MKKQTEFPDLPVGLDLLPDETIFSWCSRYHRLAANGQDKTTCLQLFGHERIGSAHDFPARIDELVVKTKGGLGTATEIIRKRTLLPYYLAFKSSAVARQSEAALRGEGIGSLKYRLGLLTSGLGAAHPLKACPNCMQSDFDTHGWSYWRRSHQWPGVWLCPEHQRSLWVTHLKQRQSDRFTWVLPTRAGCAPLRYLEEHLPIAGNAAWMLKLGRLSSALVDCAPGSFADPVRLAEVFRGRMKTLGMIHGGGRVRWTAVMPSIKGLAPKLICLPDFNHQVDLSLLQTQLARLLSARALTHPLRYLIWITCWFDDLENFRSEYDCTLKAIFPISIDAPEVAPSIRTTGPSKEQARFLSAACQGTIRLTAAAQQAGVSYTTMAAWASREMFEPSRRPKKLHAALWEQATNMLREGSDKMDVARACFVSEVTITRILRTIPGLQDQWHTRRYEDRRSTARQIWKDVSRLHPYLGIKAIRRLEPAAYAWLYRNDRSWLTASLKNVPKTRTRNYAAKRIQNADARMALTLQKLALQQPIRSLDELTRALPRMSKVIRNPERWPLTIKALSAVLNYTVQVAPSEFNLA